MPDQASLEVSGNKVPNWSNYKVVNANLESNDFKGKDWKTGQHYYGCDNPITPYTILDKPTNLQQAKCQLLYIKDTLNSLGQAPASGPAPSKKPPAKVVAEAAAAAAAALPAGPARNGATVVAEAAADSANKRPHDPSAVVNAVKSAASELKGPEAEGGEKVVGAAVNAAAPPPPSAHSSASGSASALPPSPANAAAQAAAANGNGDANGNGAANGNRAANGNGTSTLPLNYSNWTNDQLEAEFKKRKLGNLPRKRRSVIERLIQNNSKLGSGLEAAAPVAANAHPAPSAITSSGTPPSSSDDKGTNTLPLNYSNWTNDQLLAEFQKRKLGNLPRKRRSVIERLIQNNSKLGSGLEAAAPVAANAHPAPSANAQGANAKGTPPALPAAPVLPVGSALPTAPASASALPAAPALPAAQAAAAPSGAPAKNGIEETKGNEHKTATVEGGRRKNKTSKRRNKTHKKYNRKAKTSKRR